MSNIEHDIKPAAEYRIEVLPASFETYGMVLDLLSRHPPFADAPLAQLSKTVRRQLRQAHQVAALSADNQLVAYAGWVPSLQASAELWVENRGPLQVVETDSDALAMTIVVSSDSAVTRAMLRRARNLNPQARWFFKRSYGDLLRASRKQSLRDRTGENLPKTVTFSPIAVTKFQLRTNISGPVRNWLV